MISTPLAATLARRNVHYGWVVAGTTFLTMLVTAAAMGAPGVLIVPLEKEFGWTAEQISSALAVRLLLFGLLGPFAAALMNRFGLRRVIICALTLIVTGFVLSLGMTRVWQLMVLWGLVIGVGTGMTAMVLAATVATRWFTHRRGLVIGMLSASSATGQLIVLPLIASFTENYGWRFSLLFVCAILAVTALLVLALMRDRPADLNLPLYGEAHITPAPAVGVGLMSLMQAPLLALKEASRTGVFWILFATFFICGLSTNGLVQTHFIAMCSDYGIAAVTAASVLALMGAFDFVGTIGSGWLSDRFDNRWLLFWYYGLRGLSLLYLPFTTFTFYGLSLFGLFYGLDWIATVPPTVKLSADRFGREKAGMIFGWIFCGHQLGAATAAYGGGLIRTEYSSYLPAFFIAGAFCLLAATLALFISRPRAARGAAQPA
ncbi:MAG: MFS transporter [Pseudolabrys sp.]|jgi:MFS family permease